MYTFEEDINFNNFFEAYKEEISPNLKDIELKRNQLKKSKFTICILLCILVLVFLCYQSSVFSIIRSIIFSLYIIALISTCIPEIYYMSKEKKFKLYLKKLLLNKLLRRFCQIKYYNHKKDFANQNNSKHEQTLIASTLFAPFEKMYIDDEFNGSYKNVKFSVIEATLFHDYNNNFMRRNFKGVVLIFKFNKRIKVHTQISTKGDLTGKNISEDALLSFLYIMSPMFIISIMSIINFGLDILLLIVMLSIWLFIICIVIGLGLMIDKFMQRKKYNGLNKIILEDPKFSKRFDVYSSDEVEARYLVTPLFMELLNNLKTVFGTKKLKCSFFDDNLMIAISTKKDMFEIGDLYTPCDNPKFVLQFWKELSSVLKMIEYFKLNEKIYLQ